MLSEVALEPHRMREDKRESKRTPKRHLETVSLVLWVQCYFREHSRGLILCFTLFSSLLEYKLMSFPWLLKLSQWRSIVPGCM
jgi:hypothetical protein